MQITAPSGTRLSLHMGFFLRVLPRIQLGHNCAHFCARPVHRRANADADQFELNH
jgi:hypothetical protein